MKDLRIEIDDKSGFCFGVVRAISEAEKALAGGETVYSLGDIVHNRIEVQRLEKLGLSTVTHADMPRLTGRRLFIRAHGEPPTTYARAAELGIEVIDATCPVVARLQARVVKAHERMRPAGGQVVILGKRGHAEVVGLTGQVPDQTIVVEGEADLSQIDFTRPVYFLSQTTQSIALFETLGAEMRPPTCISTTRSAGRSPAANSTCRSSHGGSTRWFSSADANRRTAGCSSKCAARPTPGPATSRKPRRSTPHGSKARNRSAYAAPPPRPNGSCRRSPTASGRSERENR